MDIKEVRACFTSAIKDDEKGKKHKGLFIGEPNDKMAEGYLMSEIENCILYRLSHNSYGTEKFGFLDVKKLKKF